MTTDHYYNIAGKRYKVVSEPRMPEFGELFVRQGKIVTQDGNYSFSYPIVVEVPFTAKEGE